MVDKVTFAFNFCPVFTYLCFSVFIFKLVILSCINVSFIYVSYHAGIMESSFNDGKLLKYQMQNNKTTLT